MIGPVAVVYAPPATLPVFDPAWRAQCDTCRHLVSTIQAQGNTVLRCFAAPASHKAVIEYCIDARGADGACGASGLLWRPRA